MYCTKYIPLAHSHQFSHACNPIPRHFNVLRPSFTSTIRAPHPAQSHILLRKHHAQHDQEPWLHLRHLRDRRLHRLSRTPPQVILFLRSAFPLSGDGIEVFVFGLLVLGSGGGVVEVLEIGLCDRPR